ncbi:MAG: hypothetical protein IJH34_17785 [Romboutsia sp.]|nr:hypothetical protein [Romboutsia sp.]
MVKKKYNSKRLDIDLDIADIIMNDINDEYRFRVITRKYKKIFQDRNKMNDEEILNNYSNFLYKTISEKFDNKSIPERAEMIKFREFCTNKAWRLKKRWCNSAIESLDKKSNKLLNKEYLTACEDYSKYGKILSLNVDTPEDLIEERKKFLTKWASSSEYNICDYPYLTELTDKKIEAAFSQDIMLCVTEYLKKQYEYDINKIVVKSPAGVSPGLFIPNKRGRKPNTLAVTKQGENFASKMYCDVENEDGEEVETFYEFSMEKARLFKSSTGQFESLKLELVNPETEEKALKNYI